MFNNRIKIGSKILEKKKCFIVAEVSANHNKNLNLLKRFLKELKKINVDAVKLQAYQANTITINSNNDDFKIPQNNTFSKYKNLYKLYKKAETPLEWFPEIFKFCKKINLEIFASVFDETNLKILEKCNCPAYKVASPEITDIPLIKQIAKTKKPIIISNGLANYHDLNLAINSIKKINKNLILLKCTSDYPSDIKDLNLSTINYMKKKYKCLVGFSDHTLGIETSVHAASIGANMLEKHVKPKNSKSVDSFFSINIAQFKKMIERIRFNEISNGKISFEISKSSKKNLNGRRSLYVIKNIKKNQTFSKNNVKSIRPCYGLHPKYLEKIINKKSTQDISAGTRLKWSHIKK